MQCIQPNSEIAKALPYLSLEHIEAQTGRILLDPSEGQAADVKSVTHAFDTRHVLYGKLRPYLNKVALPDFSGRCTTELIPLLPAEDVDRTFLAWLLRRPETVANAMMEKTGSRMPRANMDYLMSMKVPLPPLSEQERIVAVLDEQLTEVNRARAAVEAQLGAARALPEAFLREVFDGPEAKKWPRRSLGSIGDIVTGNTPPRKEAAYYGGNIPWIKPDDLDRSLFVESSTEYLTEEGANRSRMLPAGSVLVSCIGKLGKSAISRTPLATNQQINAIVPNADIDAIYLYYAVKAIVPVMEQLASVTIVPIINKTTFSSITLPVPPTSVQRSIASRLLEQYDQQGRLLAALEAQSSEMSILPAKLLEAAFSGQI